MTPDNATQLLVDMAPVTVVMIVLGGLVKNFLPAQSKWIPPATLLVGALVFLLWSGDWSGQGVILAIYTGASATGIYSAATAVTKQKEP